MDNRVNVFVKCDLNRLEQVLDAMATLGFSLRTLSLAEPGKVIGSIDRARIPELEKIPGVINVVEDFPLRPFKP